MSLSHSLAADVLITDISNMLRSARSFVRQHGNISMLEGLDESTSWFDRLMRRFKRAETAVARTVGQPEVIHLAVLSLGLIGNASAHDGRGEDERCEPRRFR